MNRRRFCLQKGGSQEHISRIKSWLAVAELLLRQFASFVQLDQFPLITRASRGLSCCCNSLFRAVSCLACSIHYRVMCMDRVATCQVVIFKKPDRTLRRRMRRWEGNGKRASIIPPLQSTRRSGEHRSSPAGPGAEQRPKTKTILVHSVPETPPLVNYISLSVTQCCVTELFE